MPGFIRCPECGELIGSYSLFFEAVRTAYTKVHMDEKHKDYAPEKIIFKPNVAPSLEKIFDALNIKNPCSRMRLSTYEDFNKLQNS